MMKKLRLGQKGARTRGKRHTKKLTNTEREQERERERQRQTDT
jgi:hypothetical protein